MKKLKWIVCTMILAVSMIPGSALAAETPIQVTIDGVPVQWTDAAPYVDANNRTMVPLRPIGEAMGLEVEWDNADKTATFSTAYTEEVAKAAEAVMDTDNDGKADSYMGASGMVFTVNEKEAATAMVYYKFGISLESEDMSYADTGVVVMDTAAVINAGRTYAPVRYLAEFYGYTVTWDQGTKTVALTSESE